MGEKDDLRRKITFDLLAHPVSLLPATGGATALLAAWVLGSPVLFFAGGVGLLLGAGALVTRWLFGLDRISKKAMDEIQREARTQWDARLDRLAERLAEDRDPRTETLLAEMRELSEAIREKGVSPHLNRRSRIEIALQMDELFRECVGALEESLELWEGAREVASESRRGALLEQREAQIAEVAECVAVLERVHSAGLEDGGARGNERGLARAREELRASLEVARRVEQRMKTMEKGMRAEVE